MTTNTAGSSARQDPRQVSNTMRGSIVFGAASAVFQPIGVIPKGAWIIAVQLSIDTAFNGTTPTIDVGTSGTPTQFISATAGGSTGVTAAAVSTLGKAAAAGGDTTVGIRFNYAGGTPTTGACEVLIEYEGGFASTAGVEFSG